MTWTRKNISLELYLLLLQIDIIYLRKTFLRLGLTSLSNSKYLSRRRTEKEPEKCNKILDTIQEIASFTIYPTSGDYVLETNITANKYEI